MSSEFANPFESPLEAGSDPTANYDTSPEGDRPQTPVIFGWISIVVGGLTVLAAWRENSFVVSLLRLARLRRRRISAYLLDTPARRLLAIEPISIRNGQNSSRARLLTGLIGLVSIIILPSLTPNAAAIGMPTGWLAVAYTWGSGILSLAASGIMLEQCALSCSHPAALIPGES